MAERFKLISAVHLFLIREGRILLLRRFNTGWGDGLLSVVAGHLDGGEEVKAATMREAREEVGIKVQADQLRVVGVMHRREGDERIDFFLTAQIWEGEVRNCEPQRCSELLWAELTNLPADLVPYVRQAIENSQRGIWFQSYGWVEAERESGLVKGQTGQSTA
ncbi:MAG: NUDIX domain-containing protein [Anaerolineales bacterium]|jgi:ADP-ribose pyrophosphatase YjhB (NUDIX family)